jgi:hypothetical protein
MGRNDFGASFDGMSCPWGEFRWGEWSGNQKLNSNSGAVHKLENTSTQDIDNDNCRSEDTFIM